MTRTLSECAEALPLGPIEVVYDSQTVDIDVVRVTVSADRVWIYLRYEQDPNLIAYALDPDEFEVNGGSSTRENVPVSVWADEALRHVLYVVSASLIETRRSKTGDAIEIVLSETSDPRFGTGFVRGTEGAKTWTELKQFAIQPPDLLSRWRASGDLVAWHYFRILDDRLLPIMGHAAARWLTVHVASLDYLELDPDLPPSFRLLAIAEVVREAVAQGAHSIVSTLEVPELEILGFHDVNGVSQAEGSLTKIDYSAVEDIIQSAARWRPSERLQAIIEKAHDDAYLLG